MFLALLLAPALWIAPQAAMAAWLGSKPLTAANP
jgi:hypothetical protein